MAGISTGSMTAPDSRTAPFVRPAVAERVEAPRGALEPLELVDLGEDAIYAAGGISEVDCTAQAADYGAYGSADGH